MKIVGLCGPSYDVYITEDNHYFSNNEELIMFLSKSHLESYDTIFLAYDDMIDATHEDDALRCFFIDFYQGEIQHMSQAQFKVLWDFANKVDLMLWEEECNGNNIYNAMAKEAEIAQEEEEKRITWLRGTFDF